MERRRMTAWSIPVLPKAQGALCAHSYGAVTEWFAEERLKPRGAGTPTPDSLDAQPGRMHVLQTWVNEQLQGFEKLALSCAPPRLRASA
jgi:hypothetical protein